MLHLQIIEKTRPAIILSVVLTLTLAAFAAFGQTTQSSDTRQLPPGQTLERELAGGQSHKYKVEIKANELLQVKVEQKGVDVVVKLFDKNGKQLAEMDSPNGTQGFEILPFIAADAGVYTVEVGSLEANAAKGNYTIFLETPRAATETDKKTLQAKTIFSEAEALFNQRTAEAYQAAREKFLAASRLHREIGNKVSEAQSLVWAGVISDDLGEKRTALEYFSQALPLYQAISDKKREAKTLNDIGKVYSNLGEKQKALDYYNQSLLLFRTIGGKEDEAIMLNNIGKVYGDLGESQKALDYYNQSLFLARTVGNKRQEATTLSNIGKVYFDLGENQKALDYYNQSLPLRRAVNDKHGEAVALNNIAALYSALGERQKALEHYNQSLLIARVIIDKAVEATMLSNIGSVYSDLGEKQKALEHYNQALPLIRAISDKAGEATLLSNIGLVYDALGEKQKALEYYNQSLPLRRVVGDKAGEAVTLNNTGNVYFALGEKQKALEYLQNSLLLSKAVGIKSQEAHTLNALQNYWNRLNNPALAIVFGKQSVNVYQQLRSNIEGLDKSIQQTYLKRVEENYRELADILIAEGRLAEAQQILNSFQDQQFFDFGQQNSKLLIPPVVSPREQSFALRYNQTSERVGSAGSRLEELKRQIGNRQPSAEEAQKIKQLEADLKTATGEFLAALKQAESEFSKPADEKDRVPAVADLTEMQAALRETSAATGQKTVALYTLAAEDNFRVLLITPDDIKAFSSPVKAKDLDKKVLQFYAVLQSPNHDPRPLGRELYNIVFKPVEAEIKKTGAQTLLWNLDGTLSYVPVAALSPDGKSYLVEQYQTVVFTRADKERITRAVSPKWTGIGFGSSQPQTIDLLGDGSKIVFSALPGVRTELDSIFRTGENDKGIITGTVLSDAQFNKASFLTTVKQKRPLVHISSHFSFRPGDDTRSFLLLGDGTALTLNELKRQERLFDGVELLTLSACNTAATQPDASGREIDGFAELAQRLGAGAVMATLWQVSDASTPRLMRDFYALRQNEQTNLNKAESLRKAQLSLLNGAAKTEPLSDAPKGKSTVELKVVKNAAEQTRDNTRADLIYVSEKDAPPFKKDVKKPFAHPYYWSPFVLVGNWK